MGSLVKCSNDIFLLEVLIYWFVVCCFELVLMTKKKKFFHPKRDILKMHFENTGVVRFQLIKIFEIPFTITRKKYLALVIFVT